LEQDVRTKEDKLEQCFLRLILFPVSKFANHVLHGKNLSKWLWLLWFQHFNHPSTGTEQNFECLHWNKWV